jgi:hypothetical protein
MLTAKRTSKDDLGREASTSHLFTQNRLTWCPDMCSNPNWVAEYRKYDFVHIYSVSLAKVGTV